MSNPFNVTTTSGDDSTFNIWRGELDGDGNPIYAEASYQDYDVVRKGEYNLRVTGLREPREQTSAFGGEEPTTKTITAVEFEIIDGRESGKRVLIDWLTLKLSSGGGKFSPSNLYRIFSAAVPEGGSEAGDMIGRPLSGYLTQKIGDDGQPRYMRMSFDLCAPYEDESAAPADNPFNKKTA